MLKFCELLMPFAIATLIFLIGDGLSALAAFTGCVVGYVVCLILVSAE